jgi:hypothetical protein
MKRFLAIYTGSPAAHERAQWNQLDPDARRAREAKGIQAWIQWGETHTAAIVDQGTPIGKTKRTGPEGVTDIKNQIAGYVIVQAESHAAAAKLFDNHPHFSIFPGDSVEIMECLPLPAAAR